MRRRLSLGPCLLTALLAVSMTPTAHADLLDDDEALIGHILRTDHVLSRVVANCRAESLRRVGRDGTMSFTYSAVCDRRPAPEDDCPSYRVTAIGTVDRADWATVRDLRMELQCVA